MASVVDICNMALSHIGSDAIVTSITPPDGTVEAGFCLRFYPIARAEMLNDYPYAFSKTRVLLAEAANNPSTLWSYAYALPSDCLNALRVLQLSTVQEYEYFPFGHFITSDELSFLSERGSADFEVEGSLLLTHEPGAVLLYTKDITDTAKFTPKFTTALSYLLASYLAGPIIKGREGANAAASLRQQATSLAGQAMANDAASSSERAEHIAGAIRARA